MSARLTSSRHPACLPIEELIESCAVKRTRGSGPGGQHRNKVETAIVITHEPSGIVGQASEKRSQHRNREAAIERLRVNLAVGIRTVVDGETPPSGLWVSRVKSKKIIVNPSHEDFPSLLAESLDFVAAFDFNVGEAAEHLAVSSSQLVKFFKLAPPALELVNRERVDRSLRRLT